MHRIVLLRWELTSAFCRMYFIRVGTVIDIFNVDTQGKFNCRPCSGCNSQDEYSKRTNGSKTLQMKTLTNPSNKSHNNSYYANTASNTVATRSSHRSSLPNDRNLEITSVGADA